MFSKTVYKNQNGKVYVILSYVMLIFFILFCIMIISSIFVSGPIEYPKILKNYEDFLSPLIGTLCMIGFIGFPFSLCLYKGMKNLYVKSKLKIEDNKIIYDRQVEYEWTAAGHLNTKNLYEISGFDSYKITSRWIILYGKFRYTEIYKGKNNSNPTTKTIKIARAFDTNDNVISFIKKMNCNNDI